MRGRYLMREYWTDSDLFLRLSAEEREFYIGLWMLADDEGWMPRDIPAIAGHLLRFEDRAPREVKTRTVLRRLAALGKVNSLRCGCLHLPAVTKYPRAGKKSTEHHAAHTSHSNGFDTSVQTHSNGFEPIQTDLNPSPVPSRRLLTQSDVTGASARGEDRESEFRAKVTPPRVVA